MTGICRFCLKGLGENEKFFEITDEIRQDFLNVTQFELILSVLHTNIVCELCLRSLQLASTVKLQFIENQKKFITIQEEDEEDIIEMVPKIKEEVPDSDNETGVIDESDINTELLYPQQSIETTKSTQRSSNMEYECDICHKKFRNSNSVRQHKQLHDRTSAPLKMVKCGVCGKEYKGKAGLTVHMLQHGTPQFKCHICKKEIYDKQSLQYHIMSQHLKQKNHQCNECPKAYFKKSDLKRHILAAHTRENFCCTFPSCEQIFNREEKCRAHIYETHPNENIEDLIKVLEKNRGRKSRRS